LRELRFELGELLLLFLQLAIQSLDVAVRSGIA